MTELLLLAGALAMDATAAAAGLGAGERALRPVVVGSVLFGVFQAAMSGLGWWAGVGVASVAAAWDHWIAFVLLSGVGAKTIREAWTGGPRAEPVPRGLVALLVLAVATSIDALAAGVTLPTLGLPGLVAVSVIGLVTGGLSLVGGLAGRALGDRFGSRLELVGGVVLIGIGVRILVEHTLRAG